MTAAVLQTLRAPVPGRDSVTLDLVTQTPLYTGGIGQWGDQLHPSGLLGSIRFFSCLVARTLGENAFEAEVWGNAGEENHHAKRIGLRWDFSGTTSVSMPHNIRLNSSDKHRGWFFNKAYKGSIRLAITRLKISQEHWQILMLALRIQIRFGMFGAKDQFGCGVLGCRNINDIAIADESFFQGLLEKNKTNLIISPTLRDALFAKIKLGSREPSNDISSEERIKPALELRRDFRNLFRSGYGKDADHIRHYICGHLDRSSGFGTGFNVSAAYPQKDAQEKKYPQARLFLLLPHTSEPEPNHKNYKEIIKHREAVIKNKTNIIEDIESWIKKKQNPMIKRCVDHGNIAAWMIGLSR